MIDHQTYYHLQDVIRRQGRSLLQYAGESVPWNTPEEQTAVDKVRQLTREEGEGAAALSRYLVKHRLTPPYLGAYPSYFTSYNFLGLNRLLPLLVEHQKRGITDLEADVKAVRDEETRKQVQVILEMKKQHLETLLGLIPAL